jgi:TetR/AcrR family transcriptional regulator, tetracycline repressor protein
MSDMPRPAQPLISRDKVIRASLRIIDEEGLGAFSLLRLARELSVRGPSLYHHFDDKAEILRAVARAVVLETRLPAPDQGMTWIEWLVALCLSVREAVLRHRKAAPLLLEFMPRNVLTGVYDANAQFLTDLGVPAGNLVLVIDGLDKLTLGSIMSETAKDPEQGGQIFASVSPGAEPTLAAALDANTRDATELFAESIRSFLRGAVPEVPPGTPAPSAVFAAAIRARRQAATAGSGYPLAPLAGGRSVMASTGQSRMARRTRGSRSGATSGAPASDA